MLLIVNGKLDAHHKAKVNLYTLENTVSKIIDLFRIIKMYVTKNVKNKINKVNVEAPTSRIEEWKDELT